MCYQISQIVSHITSTRIKSDQAIRRHHHILIQHQISVPETPAPISISLSGWLIFTTANKHSLTHLSISEFVCPLQPSNQLSPNSLPNTAQHISLQSTNRKSFDSVQSPISGPADATGAAGDRYPFLLSWSRLVWLGATGGKGK